MSWTRVAAACSASGVSAPQPASVGVVERGMRRRAASSGAAAPGGGEADRGVDRVLPEPLVDEAGRSGARPFVERAKVRIGASSSRDADAASWSRIPRRPAGGWRRPGSRTRRPAAFAVALRARRPAPSGQPASSSRRPAAAGSSSARRLRPPDRRTRRRAKAAVGRRAVAEQGRRGPSAARSIAREIARRTRRSSKPRSVRSPS